MAVARFTSFRFRLDPTVEQQALLSRHTGTARFAFNQCLAMTKAALERRRRNEDVRVPCKGSIDLYRLRVRDLGQRR
ncbi:helix-turn-helix domain-containing protein [Nocardia sp. NPDC049707]|uniref:helix-turn-helix domain-containing protein n=1 Tax=Nocardia sp. NPDC049707 TaxID=3154735 RepID=UPI0034325136